MQRLSATEFVRSFGRRNFDVQNEPIEVTSHGTPIGYYLSAHAYRDHFLESQDQTAITTYEEYKKHRKALEEKIAHIPYISMKETVLLHASQVRDIARKHGAGHIRLFGSVARGQDGPDSDLDFLVTYTQDPFSFAQHGALMEELEVLFERKIDLIDEKRLHLDLVQETLQEAITL